MPKATYNCVVMVGERTGGAASDCGVSISMEPHKDIRVIGHNSIQVVIAGQVVQLVLYVLGLHGRSSRGTSIGIRAREGASTSV